MIKRTYLLLASILLLGACNLPRSAAGTPVQTETNPAPLLRVTDTEMPTAINQAVVTSTLAAHKQKQTETPTATPLPTEHTKGEWMAYIGVDENVWLINLLSGEQQQITIDAVRLQPATNETSRTYCCPKWSTDGEFLAYRQEVSTPQESGYSYMQSLWIYAVDSVEQSILFEADQIPGYDWRPGTHELAYPMPIDMDYFLGVRQGNTKQYATGIWAIDIQENFPYELVSPERGYAIVSPRWSPDGRYLGFDEVMGMEGRGLFAYYDFDQDVYQAWEDVIGGYSWSSDSTLLAYDRLAYVPSGDERIWVNTIQKDDERAVSPADDNGYAFEPVFAPDGNILAYLAELQGPESNLYNIIVTNLNGSDPIDLGRFENVQSLSWSPDGSSLAFSAGQYDKPEIFEIVVEDLEHRILVAGRQPAWQPTVEQE